MSWGSHLAEGERNGKKASTQVGHGSRWDTDCSVVYSCRGHSSALYGGQKLCLWTTFHSITDAISPAVLCVNIGQFKETWWWNIFPVSFHNGVISLGCVVFVGVISGLLFSSKCSHGRKASSKCSCFQCCKGNKKDNQECTGGTREKKKAIQHKGLWWSLTFLYVGIESLYMVLPGTFSILDRSIRVLTTLCISSNNSPERQKKYIQSNQPFAKAPQKHTLQQHSVT